MVKLHYEQGKNNYRYLIFSITVLKRLFRYGRWVTISNIISPILAVWIDLFYPISRDIKNIILYSP